MTLAQQMTQIRTPQVASTSDALAHIVSPARTQGRPVVLVPTMGALHEGHAALIRVATQRSDAACVVVSIFVNPLQFGANEDLSRYPRTLDADLALIADAGAEVVFTPDVDTVYPDGEPQVRVDPGPPGAVLEGADRPGHFAGVLTVVAKLFGLVRPEVALFGEKDYQQLVLIRRMVSDLAMGVDILGVPTVREPDGLALSSRNRYLSEPERATALALSRALFAGAAAQLSGPAAVLSAARSVLAAHRSAADLDLSYLELRDPWLSAEPTDGPARLLIAAKVGTTRLIDNTAVDLGVRRTAR